MCKTRQTRAGNIALWGWVHRRLSWAGEILFAAFTGVTLRTCCCLTSLMVVFRVGSNVESMIWVVWYRATEHSLFNVQIGRYPCDLLNDALVALQGRILPTCPAGDANTETILTAKDVPIVRPAAGPWSPRLFFGARRLPEVMAVHVFTEVHLNAINWRRHPRRV